MNQYPIHAVNKLLPSKRELYDILTHSEHYSLKLPNFGSKTITIFYLLEVANGVHFSIRKHEYKEVKIRTGLNKIDYYAELMKLIPNLGFGIDNLPDKKCLMDVLFSINPGHQFFEVQALNLVSVNER